MTRHTLSSAAWLISLAIVATGCRSASVDSVRPTVPLPGTFEQPATQDAAASQTTGIASMATLPWTDVFHDTDLQALIRQSLANNTDIQMAAARVLEAEASVGIARANQQPVVTASLSAGGQRTPELGTTPPRTGAALALEGEASWDLDFWGRLRSTTASARARLVATDWARRAVMTALVSDVADGYFSLRSLDLQLDIAQRTLTNRRASLNLAEIREQGGATSLIDVREAEQLVYDATSTIADLERQIDVVQHSLAVLTGQPGATITRGAALDGQQPLETVPGGLPSDLLERRPDVRESEQLVVAASADLNAAKAQFFPRITLTGAGGVASTALTSLFGGPAGLWSAAAAALQPVFNGGQLRSQQRLAEARRQEAIVGYAGTVQRAFQEASDALSSYQHLREFREQQTLLEQASTDARRLADIRYQGGATSYLEVLDADTRLFASELGLARARQQELDAYVEVYRALGGGWQ
jgi:multidrug efflux system outer membrane protein